MTNEHSIPPLRELPAGRLDARTQHLVAEITRTNEPARGVAFSRFIGSRRRVAVIALALGLLVIGTAVAETTDWLTGAPAPESVVFDFGTYAPQLGFNPEPGRAVEVAVDGDTILYATTNKRGSYCLIASAPWKRPDAAGRRHLHPARSASAPMIAELASAQKAPRRTADLRHRRSHDRSRRAHHPLQRSEWGNRDTADRLEWLLHRHDPHRRGGLRARRLEADLQRPGS